MHFLRGFVGQLVLEFRRPRVVVVFPTPSRTCARIVFFQDVVKVFPAPSIFIE